MSGSTSAVLFPPVSLGRIFKILEANRVQPRSFETLDETARWFFGFEPEQEFFQFRARAFDFDKDALRELLTQPAQSTFRGEAEDERTEADALHRNRERRVSGARAGWLVRLCSRGDFVRTGSELKAEAAGKVGVQALACWCGGEHAEA